jgi:hypothetical protein
MEVKMMSPFSPSQKVMVIADYSTMSQVSQLKAILQLLFQVDIFVLKIIKKIVAVPTRVGTYSGEGLLLL